MLLVCCPAETLLFTASHMGQGGARGAGNGPAPARGGNAALAHGWERPGAGMGGALAHSDYHRPRVRGPCITTRLMALTGIVSMGRYSHWSEGASGMACTAIALMVCALMVAQDGSDEVGCLAKG